MWWIYIYDVWGNAEGGWEVNNVFASGQTIDAPHDAPLADILAARGITEKLIDRGFGNRDIIYLEKEADGKPVGELRWEK